MTKIIANLTSDLRLLNREEATVITEGFFGVAILFCTLFGNTMMLLAYIYHKDSRTNFKLYSLSLVIADLLLAVVAMPFSLVVLFKSDWTLAQFWCSFQGVVAIWSCEASIVTMALVAIHRYTCMIQPSLHKRLYSRRFIIGSIVFGWIFAIIGPIAYLFNGGSYVFVPAFALCTFDYQTLDITFAITMVVLLSVFPFSIITFCYFKVWRFVKHHNSTMQSGSVSVEEIKLTKIVALNLLGFVICWAPLVATVTVIMFKGLLFVPRQVCIFAIFMAATFGCINPVIHGTFFKDIRSLFCLCIKCKSKSNKISAKLSFELHGPVVST